MDAGTSEQVAHPEASPGSTPDGLAPYVADVEVARARLGVNLDRLQTEVRAQVGVTVEKIVYRLAVAGAAVAAGIAVRKLLTVGWRKTRNNDPPEDPSAPSTGWGEALVWTTATAVGAALAKLVAERTAASGWQKATGAPPPGSKA